ncbi:MAG: Flp family type IVb pilin [Armatimonadota bacterium]|nr:Flp family type IVb pilin [Armatimonadota bacterium]
MVKRMKELLKDEEGATMVEYALLLALIAVICILAVTQLGGKVNSTFESCRDAIP